MTRVQQGEPTVFVLASYMRDVSVTVDEFPRPGETRVGKDSIEGPGGKGSNQAIQAARCGARVSLAGAVARDAAGQGALELWAAEGICTSDVLVREAGSTGLALIVVDSQGENQIVIAPGVNRSLRANEMAAAADRIRASQLVVAQLETPIEAGVAAFALARAAGVATLLNAAPAPASLPDALWALTDIIIVNELEASALTGLPVDADPRVMATHLMSRVRLAAVITLGAQGALVVLKSGETLWADAPEIKVVDSTGAGDAFVGAFAASWAASMTARQALLRGVAAGSLACTRRGAAPAFAGRDDIEVLAQRLECRT